MSKEEQQITRKVNRLIKRIRKRCYFNEIKQIRDWCNDLILNVEGDQDTEKEALKKIEESEGIKIIPLEKELRQCKKCSFTVVVVGTLESLKKVSVYCGLCSGLNELEIIKVKEEKKEHE